MGVPCLVSDLVGCQQDLVSQGETGWVFAADSPEGLRRALAEAVVDSRPGADRERIRRAVAGRIAGYTYSQTTAGLEAALASLLPSRP